MGTESISYLGQFENPPENPQPGQWYRDMDGNDWVCSIDGAQWLQITREQDGSINTGLTQYELNKMIIGQLSSKETNGQLIESKDILKELKKESNNAYYMLLCNDIHYYTVLHVGQTANDCIEFHNLIIELLQERGTIQLISWMDVNHDAVECWIKNDDGVFMFMLFPYDWGVIECQ